MLEAEAMNLLSSAFNDIWFAKTYNKMAAKGRRCPYKLSVLLNFYTHLEVKITFECLQWLYPSCHLSLMAFLSLTRGLKYSNTSRCSHYLWFYCKCTFHSNSKLLWFMSFPSLIILMVYYAVCVKCNMCPLCFKPEYWMFPSIRFLKQLTHELVFHIINFTSSCIVLQLY